MKYKSQFNFSRLKRERTFKRAFINARIIEIPFALQSLGHLGPGGAVLDIGCTESLLPLYLAALGYDVVGLDFREYPYCFPGLRFQQGDILRMPFQDAVFDAVTCVSVLEHIGLGFYADLVTQQNADNKSMAEIHRVLRPGGGRGLDRSVRCFSRGGTAACLRQRGAPGPA